MQSLTRNSARPAYRLSGRSLLLRQQQDLKQAAIPPMSLHRFCEITGLSKVSAWRLEKRGWLRTHLIANRRYILAEDVVEFNRRLAAGEFAGKVADLSAFENRDRKRSVLSKSP